MVTTMRALLSLVMLIGFYVLTIVMFGTTVALAIAVISIAPGLVKLTFPLFAAIIGGAGYALWKAARHKDEQPPGVVLTPAHAPALWAEVNRLAQVAGTRPPDEIRIVADVNAAVSERARLLGLIGGKRYLYLGIPLLHALNIAQLRAVLAHELGHYSGSHTRLGAVAYRGRLAVAGTMARIGPWNVAGWVFKGYGRLYLLVDNAVSRRQELEADAAAVRVAGKGAAISALTEIHVVGAAFNFYLDRYLGTGAEHGLLPDDVFGGFGEMLAARTDELTRVRQQVAAEPHGSSVWDTHPPLQVRVAAINAVAEQDHAADARPASVLLPDLENIGRALQAAVVDVKGRQVLPWDEFAAQAATASLQSSSDNIFREMGRAIRDRQIGLPTVLRHVESGQIAPLAVPFFPNNTKREAVGRFHEPLEVLITLAAVRSGKARWRHSWTGAPELLDLHGNPIDLTELAKLAADPETLPQAKARLAELGIDVDTAAVVEQVAVARGADLLAGLANMSVDGNDTDLFVLDSGLVLMPAHGGKNNGRNRLRMTASNTPPDQLAKRYPYLPFEEMASFTIKKEIPLQATMALHDGRQIALKEAWTGEDLVKGSRETLVQALLAINERARR